MTLCAAAIAGDSQIVTISDTMISGATLQSDGCTLKMEPFARDWLAMFAGDDITQCLPVIQRAKKYFANRANTVVTARAAFKRAYQQHLNEMKTDVVLNGNLDMKTFLSSGKRRFTEKVYAALYERMDAIKSIGTNVAFLIFGFDGEGRPHIFTVGDQGADCTFDKPGFCCIGSGMYAADAMLHYFGQAAYKPIYETVFNLCAAKFMAERNGVGKDTFLYVKQPRSVMSSHKTGLIQEIRDAWESAGAARVPPGIFEKIVAADIHTYGAEADLAQ